MKHRQIAAILSLCLLTGCSSPDTKPDPVSQAETTVTEQTAAEQTTTVTEITTTAEPVKMNTPLETVTEEGVRFQTKQAFSDERKAVILEASKALNRFHRKFMEKKFPNQTAEIELVDSVTHIYTGNDYHDPNFVPEDEFEFHVITRFRRGDEEYLGGSEPFIISKVNGEWTTYTEYLGVWIQ